MKPKRKRRRLTTLRRWVKRSGEFRKAWATRIVSGVGAAGGVGADWAMDGHIEGVSLRWGLLGLATGLTAGAAVKAIPNDPYTGHLPAIPASTVALETSKASKEPTDLKASVSPSKASPPTPKPAPITIAAGLSPPPRPEVKP